MSWVAVSAGVQFGTGVVRGFLNKSNAKKEQKRKNDAIQARIAWLGEEKKYAKKVYELQTFSTAFDAASAGTAKIARSAALGSLGSQDANYLNQFSSSLMNRDIAVQKMGHNRELLRMDNEIKAAASQLRDPGDVGDDAFWSSVFEGGAGAAQTLGMGLGS